MRESAKAIYGLNSKDYLTPKDKNFLREGVSTVTNQPVFQLTEPSDSIGEFHGKEYGGGQVAVEERDHGGHFEHGMPISKIIFKG